MYLINFIGIHIEDTPPEVPADEDETLPEVPADEDEMPPSDDGVSTPAEVVYGSWVEIRFKTKIYYAEVSYKDPTIC